PDLFPRDFLQSAYGTTQLHVDRAPDPGARWIDRDVVPQEQATRFSGHEVGGAQHRIAEAPRARLPHVHDSRGPHQGLEVLEGPRATRLREILVELQVRIEVVFDRPLAATRDDEDLPHPARDGLLDDKLDRGLVDDRDHLLRHGLRVWKEPSAQPGGGDDRFHRVAKPTHIINLFWKA